VPKSGPLGFASCAGWAARGPRVAKAPMYVLVEGLRLTDRPATKPASGVARQRPRLRGIRLPGHHFRSGAGELTPFADTTFAFDLLKPLRNCASHLMADPSTHEITLADSVDFARIVQALLTGDVIDHRISAMRVNHRSGPGASTSARGRRISPTVDESRLESRSARRAALGQVGNRADGPIPRSMSGRLEIGTRIAARCARANCQARQASADEVGSGRGRVPVELEG
jgi:hypothetical protein